MKNDVIYVGVDDGFRQTKIVTSNGVSLSIPSTARVGFTLTAIGKDDAGMGGYESEGRQFTVDAEIDGEDTRYDDYAFNEINRVLVNHALQLAGMGGKEIRLATGLPFQSFYSPGTSEPNQALIDQKKANLAIEVKPLNGQLPPKIIRQQVTAQGLAAVIDYFTDDQGNLRDGIDVNAPVAVLDIGGRTTDTVTVYGGGKLDHVSSGTANIGISNVYDHMENELKRKFSVSKIRLATLDHVARHRTIRLRGVDHDVSGIVNSAVAEIGAQVIREAKRRIGDAAEMQSVILVGGGAMLMREVISKEYPHCVVPHAPELANARGMRKYLQYMVEE